MQVVDLGYRDITLVTSDAELAVAVRTTRTVRVIPIGGLIARVRSACRRLATSQRTGQSGHRASRQRRKMDAEGSWTGFDGSPLVLPRWFKNVGLAVDSSISSSFGIGAEQDSNLRPWD